ncbi:hypothetical protein BSL78_17223, partial [Apostichopus japonicus]
MEKSPHSVAKINNRRHSCLLRFPVEFKGEVTSILFSLHCIPMYAVTYSCIVIILHGFGAISFGTVLLITFKTSEAHQVRWLDSITANPLKRLCKAGSSSVLQRLQPLNKILLRSKLQNYDSSWNIDILPSTYPPANLAITRTQKRPGDVIFVFHGGCEFFEAPENGNVIYDPVNRTVGSTATFSCSSGYVLSGNASLECLETKEWNATNDVSCVAECNRDETQVTVLRRTCMKTCVTAGDCLRGRPCVCDGVCGLSCIPTARVNYCDVTLVQVDNTVVTLDPATLVFGTVATISCSPGHLPIGGTREIQRSCLGNGDWSDGSLTCIPSDACRNPPEIENASHDVKLYYANGESLRYSCNSGYASGSNSYLRCVDGNWSEANIRCIAVQCSPPDATENGRKDGSGTDYNDRVSFSCDQGFSLHGESVLICQGDGTWSADVPECTDTCRNPPEIENASHDVKQSYANGERLHYSCNLGYVLGSNSYMQCVDGSWLEQVINCRAVQCTALDTPVNGSKDGSGTGYNDRVEFSCDQGFSLHGESVLTCQSDETWSADAPKCTAKSCGYPGDINNGGIIEGVYTYPNSVTYVCDEGFTLNGQTTRTCQTTQDWSGIAPSCNPVQCPALFTPVNGRKDGSGTGYNNRVEFSCDQGFSLLGESVLTCQSDGTWSSHVPECTGYCQKPREDVMWVFNDSCQGISVQPNKCGLSYLCDDGYFPINQKVIWSCSKGIWQKNAEPICST